MVRKVYTLLAASALTAFAAPQTAPPGWPPVLDGYQRALQQGGIVGSSLMVVRDGHIVARQNQGLQNLDARAPITNETIYHWASITKTFTGIAIMQLRDRGLLSLDDPVVKYVPELRLAHDPFGDISQVKIRHLMSHSAGFRASTWPWGGDQPWHPFEPTSWEQLVAMLPYTDVQFAPGSKYSYSNPGVIFLGRIIQLLSGDDYEIYVTKNILMPLGMRSTFFDRAPYYLLPHRSHSYFRDDKRLREARFDFDTGITVSNGGLNAPFDDMGKYLAFLLGAADHADQPRAADHAVYDTVLKRSSLEAADHARAAEHADHAEYETVLKRSSLEEMWMPQIRAVEGEGVNGTDSHAALSFFVERYSLDSLRSLGAGGDVELVGHSGDQNGFISHLYLHRPSRTGWLLSMNTDTTPSKDGRRIGSRQVDAAVRELMLKYVTSALNPRR
jgi:CubicO group peptidase (beta-lactamase class C family)